ncbi:SOS response-associated peptidase [Mycolicibacterium chitae]|uniref:Abasic site processing protein n=1 Tax=Mycolicibacterium chitae TaxID=1792 RepID=A0A448I9T6_MYCCI|nr:SOS response-associated peptidase [Mycolicibacterium chitae]MCV7107824.1 SOS response-associated peptidase [Mycolicibacterium chitae]VEG49161.1 bacteriophage protein [Mycolicibacterium chitae]
MCGRFAVTTDPALLAQKIQALDETAGSGPGAAGNAAGNAPNSAPNYNVAPTTTISSVVKRHTEPEDESTRRVRSMRWGLVPPWVKAGPDGGPENKGPLLINARAETVTESPAFRNSAKNKRCLIPMDGWYEWMPHQGEGKAKGPKTPFYMYAEDGEQLFAAGLWTTWRPKGADKATPPLLSCTIITTDSAGPLAEIHDRMPLTISSADWDRWMDPDAPADEGLLRGHGDLDRIVVREVSTLVNSVRNNGPELIAPAPPQPEQAELF